jgi:hypothetical protein
MTYQIQGFQTLNTERGCDAERSADTIKDARREAKYMLSDDYRRASESSAKLATVQIWKGGELITEMEG